MNSGVCTCICMETCALCECIEWGWGVTVYVEKHEKCTISLRAYVCASV